MSTEYHSFYHQLPQLRHEDFQRNEMQHWQQQHSLAETTRWFSDEVESCPSSQWTAINRGCQETSSVSIRFNPSMQSSLANKAHEVMLPVANRLNGTDVSSASTRQIQELMLLQSQGCVQNATVKFERESQSARNRGHSAQDQARFYESFAHDSAQQTCIYDGAHNNDGGFVVRDVNKASSLYQQNDLSHQHAALLATHRCDSVEHCQCPTIVKRPYAAEAWMGRTTNAMPTCHPPTPSAYTSFLASNHHTLFRWAPTNDAQPQQPKQLQQQDANMRHCGRYLPNVESRMSTATPSCRLSSAADKCGSLPVACPLSHALQYAARAACDVPTDSVPSSFHGTFVMAQKYDQQHCCDFDSQLSLPSASFASSLSRNVSSSWQAATAAGDSMSGSCMPVNFQMMTSLPPDSQSPLYTSADAGQTGISTPDYDSTLHGLAPQEAPTYFTARTDESASNTGDITALLCAVQSAVRDSQSSARGQHQSSSSTLWERESTLVDFSAKTFAADDADLNCRRASCPRKIRPLHNPIVIKTLRAWYEASGPNTSANRSTLEQLAAETGITIEQVRKWLYNTRFRKGQTKKHRHVSDVCQ